MRASRFVSVKDSGDGDGSGFATLPLPFSIIGLAVAALPIGLYVAELNCIVSGEEILRPWAWGSLSFFSLSEPESTGVGSFAGSNFLFGRTTSEGVSPMDGKRCLENPPGVAVRADAGVW